MTFDFITHKELRASLDSDYQEILACLSTKCWKAVHVLSGNIIEAVLVDFLIASDHEKKTGKDPLKLSFVDLIETCQKQGFISQKTAELCNVVKSYRNLIHPGRCIRLEESVDEPGAKIAQALVDLVVDEIAAKRSERFGYTAEQVVSKLAKDPSASAIIGHLLESVSEYELEQLLLSVLPSKHYETLSEIDAHYEWDDDYPFAHHYRGVASLEDCFRKAIGHASENLKARVAKRYVEILKEESESVVTRYGRGLFKASDFVHLSSGEQIIVKRYLASKLKEDGCSDWLATLEGIGTYLTQDDLCDFLDPLIRTYSLARQDDLESVQNIVIHQMYLLNNALQTAITRRVDDWISHHKKHDQLEIQEKLQTLKNEIEFSDIPF